jgi:hypothetical protein
MKNKKIYISTTTPKIDKKGRTIKIFRRELVFNNKYGKSDFEKKMIETMPEK